MGKSHTWQTFLTIGSGMVLGVAVVGGSLIWAQQQGWLPGISLPQWSFSLGFRSHKRPLDDQSTVLPLAVQPPEQRREELEAIASQSQASFDRHRARYLLAMDLLADLEGGPALRWLEGLEQEYPALAPMILLKQARGYELTNSPDRMAETLKTLMQNYPESAVIGEALVQLGATNPQYWQDALVAQPHHPAVHEMVHERIRAEGQQLPWILFLVRYDSPNPVTTALMDQIVIEAAEQLTPADWEAVGDRYWEEGSYSKAASAYRRSPPSAQTLYRIARGQDLSGQSNEARLSYQNLANRFPNDTQTGQGLLHLARLSSPQDAIPHLNQIIEKFPDHAPEALDRKADHLETLRRGNAASQTRQDLLDQYPNAEITLNYRWAQAQKQAEAGNYASAWKWAYPIAINNPNSTLAPKAAFWVGKWASRLGREEDARTAYEFVLKQNPESYYAWRAAAILGWNVGTFTTVRQFAPTATLPTVRPQPPAGSELFQELYQLGQDQDAGQIWQVERRQGEELTVEQQFTDGLLKVTAGDYIRGITDIWSLRERDQPLEREAWAALRQQPAYWQTLFPFPYSPLVFKWSQERQLNSLLVIALIRQESRFQPAIRSSAGALGLMQVMPETAQWIAQQTEIGDYQLDNPEDNIELGTWFLDYTHREFDGNSMLAIASYNAGPGNVSQWKRRFPTGDPDEFVEKIPFPETKGYVEAVFGNYWNYLRIYNPEIREQMAELAAP
ncbi:transglycosylase SLT domain-containing protein [Spirulina sp. CCNP1310]|uniref:lytic transglycosylase domain-containing protein n=1 Tax=Spirulina sp. CCNP1310 TaxID=3110249 RepID=UPI002B1FEFFD|nr:transglycosylase SLT domain-containing protein [Spirulina sp. CCNP1310]MEA5421193.1 transglycosylase SLT domain-containing protein [Spirulina sp. CCNP1310]